MLAIQRKWVYTERVLAAVLIALTVSVSLPLTIKTYREGGGPWGFGLVGLQILVPLTTYVLFAVAALLKNEKQQWLTFITAHLVSLYSGLIFFLVFPVLPKVLLFIPALLAAASLINRKRLPLYLSVMLGLGIAANVVLLKWEVDFGRRLPVIELFEPAARTAPEP